MPDTQKHHHIRVTQRRPSVHPDSVLFPISIGTSLYTHRAVKELELTASNLNAWLVKLGSSSFVLSVHLLKIGTFSSDDEHVNVNYRKLENEP